MLNLIKIVAIGFAIIVTIQFVVVALPMLTGHLFAYLIGSL
jgi:hypothetical protein